jgi:hypothetical protein
MIVIWISNFKAGGGVGPTTETKTELAAVNVELESKRLARLAQDFERENKERQESLHALEKLLEPLEAAKRTETVSSVEDGLVHLMDDLASSNHSVQEALGKTTIHLIFTKHGRC